MIKIHHKDLTSMAFRHYQAIVDYLPKAVKENRLDAINQRIQAVFGKEMDFEKLVVASPDKLEDLAKNWNIEDNNQFQYFITLYDYFSTGDKLNYKVKDGKDKTYNGLQLVHDLDLSVCPYCNRNFIFNTNENGKRTCNFDHFFSKNKFPFLAVSFYNLIPACKFCDHTKKDKWNTNPGTLLINPYDTDEPFPFDVSFEVKITGAAFYYKEEEFEIRFKEGSVSERFQNHIDAFHLKDLYSQHTDYVIELIQKKYLYNDDYLNALFKQYEGTLFRNREDLLRLVTANFVDDKDLKNRPLSKLTKDISEQLDL